MASSIIPTNKDAAMVDIVHLLQDAGSKIQQFKLTWGTDISPSDVSFADICAEVLRDLNSRALLAKALPDIDEKASSENSSRRMITAIGEPQTPPPHRTFGLHTPPGSSGRERSSSPSLRFPAAPSADSHHPESPSHTPRPLVSPPLARENGFSGAENLTDDLYVGRRMGCKDGHPEDLDLADSTNADLPTASIVVGEFEVEIEVQPIPGDELFFRDFQLAEIESQVVPTPSGSKKRSRSPDDDATDLDDGAPAKRARSADRMPPPPVPVSRCGRTLVQFGSSQPSEASGSSQIIPVHGSYRRGRAGKKGYKVGKGGY